MPVKFTFMFIITFLPSNMILYKKYTLSRNISPLLDPSTRMLTTDVGDSCNLQCTYEMAALLAAESV
jgi:hypothetical protein